MTKSDVLAKIKNDEEAYMKNILKDIKVLNEVENDAPKFKSEHSPRKNKFGHFNVNLIDEANGLGFMPDNATIKNWGEQAQYTFIKNKKSTEKLKEIFNTDRKLLIHIYVWMITRGIDVPAGWEIHHLNGNHFDNRAENMVCVPKNIHILLDTRSKEIKRTRKLTELEEWIVDEIYGMYVA